MLQYLSGPPVEISAHQRRSVRTWEHELMFETTVDARPRLCTLEGRGGEEGNMLYNTLSRHKM